MDKYNASGQWNEYQRGNRPGAKGFEMLRQRNRSAQALGLGILSALLVLGIGILAVGLNYGKKPEPEKVTVVVEKEAPVQMATVLIPVRQIKAGEELKRAMFREATMPSAVVGDFALRSTDQVDGLYARSLIIPEQPVNKQLVTPVRPGTQISYAIPAGYRAVAIRVDEISSVEGWVKANARVDVHMITLIRNEKTISSLVQNALILSAQRNLDQEVKPGDPVPGTVTIMVTADDAQRIQLAQKVGELTLSLRGAQDEGKFNLNQTTVTATDLKPRTDGDGGPRGPRVTVRNPDGSVEELVLDQRGNLIPSDR